MKHFYKLFFITILSAFASAAEIMAQSGTIEGIVKDSLGAPVAGVSVFINGTGKGDFSTANGKFSISKLRAGQYELVTAIFGYREARTTVVLAEGQTTSVEIVLKQQVGNLKEVRITASGIREEIADVPGTINVIDEKAIKESGAQNVGQIITRVPGVNYLDEDGRGLKPNIGLRGLDPLRNRNLLVLVDGKFPIGMTYYGDPAAYYMIPVQDVARIEVIKGASPVLYGGYSVGGVINMITHTPSERPETRLSLGYGSFNTLNAQVSTGADKGAYNYYASGLRRQGDGFRDRSGFSINDYTVRLGFRPDSSTEVSLYVNAFGEKSETPGGLTQKQYDEDPTQTQHPHDNFYSQRYSTALSYKKIVAKDHVVSASVYGNYFERNWWIAYKTPVASGFLRDIHALGSVVDYNMTKPIAGRKNSLIAGVRVHTDRLDDINIAGDGPDSRTGKTTGNKINTSFIYEGYIYDEFSILKNLTFAPGIRYTSVKYHREDFIAKREDEISNDAFVYSAGLIYNLADKYRIYTTASKGYQPPALNSALAPGNVDAGVDLKPETSQNYEAGLRLNPLKMVAVNLAAYSMYFRNKVITENGINRNNGTSFHRGLEAEIELGAWKGISLFANGAFQKATFQNGPDKGKFLPNAPQKLTAAGLRYNLRFEKSSIVFNAYYNYVSKQYSDSKNTEVFSEDGKTGPVPAYSVVNATVNYNRKNWGVFFNLYNALDAKYYTMRWASWNGIIPSPGRNFMTGVNVRF